MKKTWFFVALLLLLSIPIIIHSSTYKPSPARPPVPPHKPALIPPYDNPNVKQVAGFGTFSHNDNLIGHTYYGVDFATSGWGEFEVKAAAAGTLKYATWNGVIPDDGTPVPSYCPEDIDPTKGGDQGRVALIDHGNGWFTVYHHLASYAVSHNTEVSQGQTIGIAGCSATKWRHLHFELRHFNVTTGAVWTYNPDLPSIPTGPNLDLLFLIDTTGSMWDDIAQVKAEASTIINELKEKNPNTRIAVMDYRDFPSRAASYDYPYRDVLPFTYDKDEAINAIQSLTLGWGGDAPESSNCALLHAIDDDKCAGQGANTSIGPWASPNKRIILMTDAPGLDPEPFTGFTTSFVTERARAGGVEFWGGPDSDPFDIIPPTPEGVVIYSIIIGGDPTALAYGQTLAEGTGGSVFAAATADDVVDAILDAITVIVTPPDPAPTCVNAFPSNGKLWPPNNRLRPIQILGIENADSVTILSIFQDEPIGNDLDAYITGQDTLLLRAQRDGSGDGRVYHIDFLAIGAGGECEGAVKVVVPHDMGIGQRERGTVGDGGPLYNSLVP